MSIMQLTRFKAAKSDEMMKTAKQAKTLFERHGAEYLRLSRFHTGMQAGEWLVTTGSSSWDVYGTVQEGLSKDPEFAKMMANLNTFAELTGRNVTVGVDL